MSKIQVSAICSRCRINPAFCKTKSQNTTEMFEDVCEKCIKKGEVRIKEF